MDRQAACLKTEIENLSGRRNVEEGLTAVISVKQLPQPQFEDDQRAKLKGECRWVLWLSSVKRGKWGELFRRIPDSDAEKKLSVIFYGIEASPWRVKAARKDTRSYEGSKVRSISGGLPGQAFHDCHGEGSGALRYFVFGGRRIGRWHRQGPGGFAVSRPYYR